MGTDDGDPGTIFGAGGGGVMRSLRALLMRLLGLVRHRDE